MRGMKDTVSRVGRITRYVVVPAELITPVSQVAAGAVVKVTRVVGTKPATAGAARVRSGVTSGVSAAQGRIAQVRVTRIRFRRGAEGSEVAQGSAPSPAPSDAPEAPASDAPAPDAPDPSI